jgi:carboxyl-terminal processing protease
MPQFDLNEEGVEDTIGKLKNRKALILDLRGNGGGYVETLELLTGYFFPRALKIADLRGRKEVKQIAAKGRQEKAFKGRLIVLVDGESASASEIFARVVQLEKRGTVIGDRTAGAVMQSRFYPIEMGVIRPMRFGVTVTEADLIMADGKSLERTGVTPDELLLPTPADMAAGRDPVLSHAASLVGVQLDPAKASTLFPTEWRKR